MFLPHLYRHNRSLFWTCVLFSAASLGVVAFRHSSTPFSTWAMYSIPKPVEARTHTFYILAVDGNERFFSPAFIDPRTYFYTSSAPHWDAVRTGAITAPRFATLRRVFNRIGMPADNFFNRVVPGEAAFAAYGPWLRRAVETRTGRTGQQLEVRKLTLQYSRPGRVRALRKEVVLAP